MKLNHKMQFIQITRRNIVCVIAASICINYYLFIRNIVIANSSKSIKHFILNFNDLYNHDAMLIIYVNENDYCYFNRWCS